ncbi:S8 family peptidase [Salibacterium sp. K-3]
MFYIKALYSTRLPNRSQQKCLYTGHLVLRKIFHRIQNHFYTFWINAPEIWDESKRGRGVVIAIIDSGCDEDHPDLNSNIISGFNFIDGQDKTDFHDSLGHGTHVAGIISANLHGCPACIWRAGITITFLYV